MVGEIDRLDGQLPLQIADTQPPTTATLKWWQEIGEATQSLGQMLRKPTGERPFVYEVKIDLLSLGQSPGKVMLKGFGEEGGLIAFHDSGTLVDAIRGVEGRMRAGKLKWLPDQYTPNNYEARVALYLSGSVYRL